LPFDPTPPEEVYDEFLEYVLPYPVGNIHPRFWGWVLGTGTVLGAFAEVTCRHYERRCQRRASLPQRQLC
jgi:hypothetical protein